MSRDDDPNFGYESSFASTTIWKSIPTKFAQLNAHSVQIKAGILSMGVSKHWTGGMKVLTSYNAAASTAQFSPRKVCFSSRARRDVDGVVIEEILPTGISCKGGPQGQGTLQRLRKCHWSQSQATWLGAFLSQTSCYYCSTIILDLRTSAPCGLSQLGSVAVLEAKIKE